jgi:hypothetical protein
MLHTSSGRANKLYRTPPTPAPEEHREREQTFVLDCSAVSSISLDYTRTNPKLGQIIPPYNGQKDPRASFYFKLRGVQHTLRLTGQKPPGDSIEGKVHDRFHDSGTGYRYLALRNVHGSGRSHDQLDSHLEFMTGLKPPVGWNGEFGYRRNDPVLRRYPSTFDPPTEFVPTFQSPRRKTEGSDGGEGGSVGSEPASARSARGGASSQGERKEGKSPRPPADGERRGSETERQPE